LTVEVAPQLSPPSEKVVEVIETLFRIPNKDGEIVPFHLNNVQSNFMSNKSGRTDVLKARQFGVTSIVLAWFLVECMSRFARCVMIAHDTDATRKLLQRGRFMLQQMNGPKPRLSRDSDQELAFPKTGATSISGPQGREASGGPIPSPTSIVRNMRSGQTRKRYPQGCSKPSLTRAALW